LRNPAEAVTLAQRACALTHDQNNVTLSILAAAYAADGRFADAAAASRLAADAATKAGDKKAADDSQKQTDLYEKESSQAHHEAGKD